MKNKTKKWAGNKAEKNCNWKGGIAEYPNHYKMKKNRLIKLQQTKSKCEICKNEANVIHHKDGSKKNHSLENLIILCQRCHSIIESSGFKHTSKFIRLYGMTLREIAKKYGGTFQRFYIMHQKGILKDFLKTS
jgi:hypothetical protein